MIRKQSTQNNYVFRQLIPSDGIGLPIDSPESLNSAEATLRRLGFGSELIDETLLWAQDLSDENRGISQVHGQLRLEKIDEGALIVLLRATLQHQNDLGPGVDASNPIIDEGYEVVNSFPSPIDNSDVVIYGNLMLSPMDHVIYDTRKCVLRGLPGGVVTLYHAQTSALSIGPQLTKVFKNWIQTCQWTPLEAKSSK
ncbi:MAG: hypothetical protein ABSE82_06640 [Nitrososphaerales archaeon]